MGGNPHFGDYMNDFEPLNPKKLASLYNRSVITKKFNSIEELTQYLENQMIIATVNDLHQKQLDYIDQAVLKSDLKEAKEVINYIMRK